MCILWWWCSLSLSQNVSSPSPACGTTGQTTACTGAIVRRRRRRACPFSMATAACTTTTSSRPSKWCTTRYGTYVRQDAVVVVVVGIRGNKVFGNQGNDTEIGRNSVKHYIMTLFFFKDNLVWTMLLCIRSKHVCQIMSKSLKSFPFVLTIILYTYSTTIYKHKEYKNCQIFSTENVTFGGKAISPFDAKH